MNTNHKLEICWSYRESPKQTSSVYAWKKQKLSADPIEERLDLPEGTIGILQAAFEKRLNRSCLWDLSGISNKAPYLTAAKLYKRGAMTSESKTQTFSGSYTVSFIDETEDLIAFLLKSEKSVYIDKNIQKHWPRLASIESFSISESSKNLESLAKIYRSMMDEQGECILVGGGVFCDTAALAAQLAGRPFTLVPTTLLSMIDACVGGKTGINFQPYGKNQLGRFAFPKAVITWTPWLATLEEKELKAGEAEALKHACSQKTKRF